MLADFYIPRFYNDMKLVVWKKYLVGRIFYRRLDPSKNGAILPNLKKTPNFHY